MRQIDIIGKDIKGHVIQFLDYGNYNHKTLRALFGNWN